MSEIKNATVIILTNTEPKRILFVIEDWFIRKERFNFSEPSFLPLATPGGTIDKGETYFQGLEREYFEEMGTKL
jgi:8-oxo-dGTP pyrophosphatase MutT (NUDIX family)